jgi:hypothetical protein
MKTREPHPYADAICHYVNGGEVEYLDVYGNWVPVIRFYIKLNKDLGNDFKTSTKYRIKPELTEKELEIIRIEEAITQLSDDLYSLKRGGWM